MRASNKAYREANKERRSEQYRSWAKGKRKLVRAAQARYRDRNREKLREYSKEYWKAHPEARRAYLANYKARKRQAVGKHDAKDILALFVKQSGRCAACREDLPADFHVDHVFPLKLGGSNDRYNLQLLCGICNSRKGAKHPIEFMQSLGFLL